MAAFTAVAKQIHLQSIAVMLQLVRSRTQAKFNIFGQAWNAITAVWGAAVGRFSGVFSFGVRLLRV